MNTKRMWSGRRRRAGFSLVEVIIALSILAGVLLGLGGFMTTFAQHTSRNTARARAADLVTGRLEFMRGVSRYDALASHAKTESVIDGFDGFTRVTSVSRVRNDSTDHMIVTVRATNAYLAPDTLRKSTIIASF